MGFGPPAGSPFGGQGAAQSNRAAGLPFSGIPPELLERVQKIQAREPEHPEPQVRYSPVVKDTERFSLGSFLRPHAGGLSMAFLLVLVATVANQAGPRLMAYAIDKGIVAGNFTVLLYVFFAYLGAIVLSIGASHLRINYTGRLGQKLMYELRVRVFSHLQRLSLGFYTEEKAGRLMTRMTSDIEALANLFQEGLVNLAIQGLTLLVITVILFTMNVKLTLIMLGVVVPVMLVLTLWFRRESDRGYARVRDRIADVLTDLQESLSGIRLIAAFNRRRHNVIKHRNVVGAHFDANVHMAKVGAIYTPSTDFVGIVGRVAMLFFGGQMVLAGELSIGALPAFILYLTAFFAPIQALVQLYNTYQSGQAAIKKLSDLLGTQPSVAQKPDATELPPIEGRIELDGVTFGYEASNPVLRGVDLTIEPGETVAFVGPTGAGKSTVAKLITRFYDPDEGTIRIDGHDLREVTLESLRRQLGVVPQEPFLFHGSIRDNLSFARPDVTEEEILQACKAVGVDDLVQRLPQGLDSLCHERGASLSSGERQLLALARAFLARPRVLILDEATSNVDLRSEGKIEQALDALLGGRTAIIIAHRLQTAMRAHRIVVIDDGRIVELGTHEELLAKHGHYAAMYALWLSHHE